LAFAVPVIDGKRSPQRISSKLDEIDAALTIRNAPDEKYDQSTIERIGTFRRDSFEELAAHMNSLRGNAARDSQRPSSIMHWIEKVGLGAPRNITGESPRSQIQTALDRRGLIPEIIRDFAERRRKRREKNHSYTLFLAMGDEMASSVSGRYPLHKRTANSVPATPCLDEFTGELLATGRRSAFREERLIQRASVPDSDVDQRDRIDPETNPTIEQIMKWKDSATRELATLGPSEPLVPSERKSRRLLKELDHAPEVNPLKHFLEL
jgi:hypothetical protein